MNKTRIHLIGGDYLDVEHTGQLDHLKIIDHIEFCLSSNDFLLINFSTGNKSIHINKAQILCVELINSDQPLSDVKRK